MPEKSQFVLIVGMGFLGEKIDEILEQKKWQVVAASKLARIDFGREIMPVDLGEKSSVQQLAASILAKFARKPDLVIHCASSSRGGLEEFRAVFLDGVKNLLEIFPDSKLILCSSSSVYGQQAGEIVMENSPANPTNLTGKILREAEELTLAQGGIVARLSGLYGPGRTVLLDKCLNTKARLEESGERWMNNIHRDDAASAIVFLAAKSEKCGEIFNVSDSTPISQLDYFKKLQERLGLLIPESVPRDFTKKRAWTNKRVSNEKLLKLGWQPKYPSFFDSLEELLEFKSDTTKSHANEKLA